MKLNDDDIRYALGRLEGKVDMVLSNQTTQAASIEKLEIRVGKLENYKAYLIGISAATGALISWLFDFLKGRH